MNCKFCNRKCQKAGKQKNGTQKLYCNGCEKYQQAVYQYAACKEQVIALIPSLVRESVSIRGIGRLLKIGLATVIRKIKLIASLIQKPAIPLKQHSFELDEVRTYIGNKENQYWIAYALCSKTKKVIDFTVGKRSKRVLRSIVNTLALRSVPDL